MPGSNRGIQLGAIGKYYGIVDRHAFVSMLNNTGSAGDALSPPETTDISNTLADLLLSVSEGVHKTPNLIAEINRMTEGATAASAEVNEIKRKVRVLYEPTGPHISDDAKSVVMTSQDKMPIFGTLVQGLLRDDSNKYSFRKVAGIDESERINEPGVGSAGSSTASIIQVFGNHISPSNRDAGSLSFFMNAIPTIEISRAVPFIDIVLIQQGPHINTQNVLSSLSMGQFLLGNVKTDGMSSIERAYLSANDSEIVNANSVDPEFSETRTDATTGETTSTPAQISTAGMELFTAPQTLVNADEVHQEIDAVDASDENAIRRRAAPVIDRFRPLMTLKSVNFTVAPSGGMMSMKTGKITLTVHDKSRLAEVAAFVRPARFGTTHLQIEYGWAHPDAQAQSSNRTEEALLFGSFIGSLRTKEKYQIVNSSFNFDDTGQVEVDLSISMLSERAVQNVNIGITENSSSQLNSLQQTIELIRTIRSRLPESTITAITGDEDVIGSLTSPQSALSLSAEALTELRRIIDTTNRSSTSSPDLVALGDALEEMIGTRGGRGRNATAASTSEVGRLRASLTDEIRDKIGKLTTTQDPFFRPLRTTTKSIGAERGGSGVSAENVNNYFSLGKAIATFVAGPIARAGNFKDTQIIFYNFNDKASYMGGRNIASFLINKSDFQSLLEEELEQLVDMNVGSFIGFINTYFLSDPGAISYGFNGLYERNRDDEDNSTRQLVSRYRENEPELFNAQQTILRDAYGPATGEVEFKMPTLQMVMETVPVARAEGTATGAVDAGSDTILRIHIFDSQSTSHSTLQSFLEARMYNRIGELNSASQALVRSREPDADGNDSESSSSAERSNFQRQLQLAMNEGLIEIWPPTSAPSSTDPGAARISPNTDARYRMRGGFGNLKRFIMRNMPSIRHGEASSGILSAKISSMSDPALSTVNMLRQARSPDAPTDSRERGIPLQIAPVECQLETIGCPLWNYGQQIFIDFGTGTTIDAIYAVGGVEHSIAQGEYKTSVKLMPINSYARYISMFDQIDAAVSTIRGIEEGSARSGTGGSAAGTTSR
jgi:hypothetical protein